MFIILKFEMIGGRGRIDTDQAANLMRLYRGIEENNKDPCKRVPKCDKGIGAFAMCEAWTDGDPGEIHKAHWRGTANQLGHTTEADWDSFTQSLKLHWNSIACEVCGGHGHIHT